MTEAVFCLIVMVKHRSNTNLGIPSVSILLYIDGGWKLIDSELFPNNCTINPYFGQSESIYYPDNNVICIQKFRTESEAPWLAFRYEDDDLTADDVETENILLSCFL